MQVSDYRQLNDGRILVVLQALSRFLVVDAVRHGSPHGIATVEILPDLEMVEAHLAEAEDAASTFDFAINDETRGAACAGAVAEAVEWHSYEFKSVEASHKLAKVPAVATFDSKAVASDDTDAVRVAMEDYLSQSPSTMYVGECSLGDDNDELIQERSLNMEQDVWLEVDTMTTLLSKLNPKANIQMPVPPQMLGLIPINPVRPWPKDFRLEKYRKKMKGVYNVLGKTAWVEDVQLQTAQGYPALRRARRLSYVIWALLNIISGEEEETLENRQPEMNQVTRQDILEMDSTAERLEAAKLKTHEINILLREVLDHK